MASASATTSSSAIARRFAELRAANRRALITYVTAGFPTIEESRELIARLPEAGVDIVEVGVPFSDPLADGPTIQASSQRALGNGMTLNGVLEIVATVKPAAPTVLFTYLNPLLAAGHDAPRRVAAAGVAGILITDLPVGVDPELERRITSSGLAFVRLVAPTTTAARAADIARHASGFVYVISRLGVTGARSDMPASLRETLARVRAATDLPVCVGFGISTPDQAATAASFADGVIVGSALVEAASRGVDAALTFVRTLREAIDGRPGSSDG